MINTIFYLIGFPGIGKWTIAKEMANQADLIVVDNHLINLPIFTLLRPDGSTPLDPEVWEKVRAVWRIVFDTIVDLSDSSFSFVLTNVLLENNKQDHARFDEVVNMADKRGAQFIAMRLICTLEENQRRMAEPMRAARLKMTDITSLESLYQTKEVLKPDHPNTYTLDISDLAPVEAAKHILQKAESFPI